MTAVRGRGRAVVLAGALTMLAAGPANAADWDLDNLPAWATTDKVLVASIEYWPLEGSVEDLATTTKGSGETVITLDSDILFDFAKSALPPAAPARIAATVGKVPTGSAVSISGHTDNVGTGAANIRLSQARARAVAAAVKAARPDLVLTVKGFGESRPVASNTDDAGRSENRRVEIRFAS